jgi:histidine triad (HIT) family protein
MFVAGWSDAVAFVPLNPVTRGHVLIASTAHVEDALADPVATAFVMRRAAEWATAPCNLITSVGAEATQTVRHLHIHVVPRSEADGLALPWTEVA